MTQADQIRTYVMLNYIAPARHNNRYYVIVQSGDVHKGLNLAANYPNVCQALDGQIFLKQAKVRLVERSGPKQSSTVEWVFKV